jgi:serine/threonine protein kinase
VILRQKYGPSVDIWSLGCVAAELFLGSPLFPGTDEIEMLQLIQLKLGIMPSMMVRRVGDDSVVRHSDAWRLDPSMYSPGNFELFMRGRAGRDDFDLLAFINLLRLMLQLTCDARITASSALQHPFVTGFIDAPAHPRTAVTRRDSLVDDSTSGASAGGKRTRRFVRRTSGRGSKEAESGTSERGDD